MSRMAALLLAGLLAACSLEQPLVTGFDLTPPPSFAQDIGSLPVNLALTPDHCYAVTTDVGFSQSLHLIRLSDGRSIAHLDYPNDPPRGSSAGEATPNPVVKTNGLYYGLVIAPDNTLFAAQGANDSIAIISINNQVLMSKGSIATRPNDFPAGLALDTRGLLYVANQSASANIENPLTASGSIAIYNTASRSEIGRYTFKDSFFGTSNFPLALAVLPDGSKLYVASERDSGVYVLNTSNPAAPQLVRKIDTGAHPTALCFTRDFSRLFVANADSDTVSIISTQTDMISATVALRPDVARKLPGATPLALSLSSDESTLYVALADMNAIAVVDIAATSVRGYIPTGWYPSAITTTQDEQSLLILNAKGTLTRLPNDATHHSPLSLVRGNAQLLPIPAPKDLPAATEQVLKNNHYERLERSIPEPLATITRKSGKITHVIYIIKENRTYDQVLGDLAPANGDPSLCLFPQPVTPNQHALAQRFGILDNLYACGEVSGDGWDWSTQSMADSHVIRNVPYHYSRRGRKFDYEGQNNGYPTGGAPATEPDGKPLMTNPAFKDGLPPIPDVAEAPGGHLWDLCTAHGVIFRNYGFFGYSEDKFAGVAGGPENYPASRGLQPAGRNLAGLTDIDFRRFDLDYPDSDAPSILAKTTGDSRYLYETTAYGQFNSPSRFAEFNREFQLMLTKDPTGNSVPALIMLRLPTDHTMGTRPGKHTPAANVADNDYAVGQIVEAISHSPLWPHTAIFIIEDDAQSGTDHVDCHRTTGFVISPFLRRDVVDHHFYNTNTFLRTMEILLDLPPMTQYDATATILQNWSATPDNIQPYTASMPDAKYFLQVNASHSASLPLEAQRLAKASAEMDFSREDAAPAQLLNEIIWKSVKGYDSPMPAPRTAQLLPTGQSHDDDDDD